MKPDVESPYKTKTPGPWQVWEFRETGAFRMVAMGGLCFCYVYSTPRREMGQAIANVDAMSLLNFFTFGDKIPATTEYLGENSQKELKRRGARKETQHPAEIPICSLALFVYKPTA